MSAPFEMNVSNGPLQVGVIRVTGIASSSSMLLGDTESIIQYSYFDTPPESVIVGPLVPLPPLPEEEVT